MGLPLATSETADADKRVMERVAPCLPALPKRWLQRRRLLAALDKASQHRITLVAAPAGYGKTGLVAEWCRMQQGPVVWVSFDEHSDVVERAWPLVSSSVGAALGSSWEPSSGACTLPDAKRSLDQVLDAFDREPLPVLLVLDDLDRITDPEIRGLVRTLLIRLPGRSRVILISRADPLYLPLARWRWSEELAELRYQDLAFTSAETNVYLDGQWGLSLGVDATHKLQHRTEGWPIGLQLFASRWAEADSADSEFMERLDHWSAASLLAEVLERELAEVFDHLLRLSVLDRLTPELCTAVTGADHPVDVLAELHEHGLVVADGASSEQSVFHIPRLLRDLLGLELSYRHPTEVADLHERAARVLEHRGHALEAIQHALAANLFDLALNWIEKDLWSVLSQTGPKGLIRLIEPVPRPVMLTRLGLAAAMVDLFLLVGNDDALEALLVQLEDVRNDRGSSDHVISRARLALARLRGESASMLRSTMPDCDAQPGIVHVVGAELAWDGRHQRAAAVLHHALLAATQAEEHANELAILADLVWERVNAGRLTQADLLVRRAVHLSAKVGMAQPPGLVSLAQAVMAKDRGQFERAARYGELAGQAAKRSGDVRFRLTAAAHLATILHDGPSGDVSDLNEVVSATMDRTWGESFVRCLQRRQFETVLDSGDDVAEVVPPAHLLVADASTLSCQDRVLLARYLLRTGRAERARQLAASVTTVAGAPRAAIAAAEVEAAAAQALHDRAGVVAAKHRRQKTATAETMLALANDRAFREPLQLGAASPATRAVSPRPEAGGSELHAGFEPLTERELSVLHLLPARLTYAQMANELEVSLNTVKSHIRAVYRKLRVESRQEAIDRAHQLRLLQPFGRT